MSRPTLGYLTPTKDVKRNLPAELFIDLATWQRIQPFLQRQGDDASEANPLRAVRADLVDRFITIVDTAKAHALAGLFERAKIALTGRPRRM